MGKSVRFQWARPVDKNKFCSSFLLFKNEVLDNQKSFSFCNAILYMCSHRASTIDNYILGKSYDYTLHFFIKTYYIFHIFVLFYLLTITAALHQYVTRTFINHGNFTYIQNIDFLSTFDMFLFGYFYLWIQRCRRIFLKCTKSSMG